MKTKNDLHTEMIMTRWTPAERSEIEQSAKRNGLKPAVYIRWLYHRWRKADLSITRRKLGKQNDGGGR